MFVQKRGTDVGLLPSETFPEVHVTRLSEDDFRYRDALQSLTRYRKEILLPKVSNPGAPASLDYSLDVNGEANWHLANIKTVDEQLHRTVSKKNFTDLRGT